MPSPSDKSDEQVCEVCGGRPSACRVLGHRPENERPEWRKPVVKSARDEALAKIEKAHQHVADLAAGREKWTLRIPARPDMDSDLIIADALASAKKLIEGSTPSHVATPAEHKAGCPAGGGYGTADRTCICGATPSATALSVYQCPQCGTGMEVDPSAKHSGHGDKERLDYLESELARETKWRTDGMHSDMPFSLFRRNVPITRAAIDSAISQTDGGAE